MSSPANAELRARPRKEFDLVVPELQQRGRLRTRHLPSGHRDIGVDILDKNYRLISIADAGS